MTFASPSFLWALGILIIPIIIHLFQFRRYRKLYFSDVSLLKEIQTKSQTKNQLKHLLVLFSRLAFLAFLVLAFAEPQLNQSSQSASAKNAKLIGVYIDNSLSMQAQGETAELFKLAVRDAFEIVDSYGPEVKFQLISNDLTSNQRRFVDAETFLSMLDDLELSPNFQTVNRIVEFHIDSKEEDMDKASELFLLSDFNHNIDSTAWNVDSLVSISVLPYSSINDQNIGIDSVWVDAPIILPGKEIKLRYRIKNYGNASHSNVEVKLEINGIALASSVIDVDANASLDTSLIFIPNDTRQITGKLWLNDDPVLFDNEYFFSFQIQRAYKVIEITETGARSAFAKVFDSDEFTFQRIDGNQIKQDSLANIDLLVINDIRELNTGIMASISELTKSGVNVLLTLPKECTETSRALIENEFNISIGGWDTSSLEANFIQLNDVIYKDVFDDQPKNLNFPSVSGHWKLEGKDLQPLIKLYNQDHLVAAVTMNNARVFLISTELKDGITNFHRHALFVPTLINICMESGLKRQLSQLVGSSKIKMKLKPVESYKITSLSDSMTFVPGMSYDGLLLHGMINRSGYYNLSANDQDQDLLAFNFTRKESQRQNLNLEDIGTYFKQLGLNVRQLSSDTNSLQTEIKYQSEGTKLWLVFLFLGLFFLFFESILLKLFR